MATRAENLKKINEELEQLSDDELENVAGGKFDPEKFKERIDTAKLGETISEFMKLINN